MGQRRFRPFRRLGRALRALEGRLPGHGRRARRRRRRRLAAALRARGLTLEALLEGAPYEYVHVQGEDGFRIYDTRTDAVVAFASTRQGAELWIAERVLEDLAASRPQS